MSGILVNVDSNNLNDNVDVDFCNFTVKFPKAITLPPNSSVAFINGNIFRTNNNYQNVAICIDNLPIESFITNSLSGNTLNAVYFDHSFYKQNTENTFIQPSVPMYIKLTNKSNLTVDTLQISLRDASTGGLINNNATLSPVSDVKMVFHFKFDTTIV